MDNIRIGLILGNMKNPGAPGRHFCTLAQRLGEDHRVDTVLFGKNDLFTFFDTSKDIHTISSSLSPPRWHKYINNYNLDLIYLSGTPLFGGYPAAKSTVPVVATSHGVRHWKTNIPKNAQFSQKYKWQARIQDWIGALTLDRVFCVSNYVADTLASFAPYKQSNLEVTYEAINDVYFDTEEHPRPNNSPKKYALHVATDAGVKNTQTAIDAIEKCDSDIKLVVAGLSSRDIAADASDNVDSLGFVDQNELVRWYDHSECLIHPSFHETFGRPVIEAMARQTPVIASEVCAIPEVTKRNALLVNNPNNSTKFCKYIDKILSDTALASKLCQRGEKQSQQFTWDRHINRLIPKLKLIVDND